MHRVGSELQAFEQATAHLLADYRVRLEIELKDGELLRADLPPEGAVRLTGHKSSDLS